MQKTEFFPTPSAKVADSSTRQPDTKDEAILKELEQGSGIPTDFPETILEQSGREVMAQANGTVSTSSFEENLVSEESEDTYSELDYDDSQLLLDAYEPVANPRQVILSQLLGLRRAKELKADIFETHTFHTAKPTPDFMLRNKEDGNCLHLCIEQNSVRAISTDPKGNPVAQIFIGQAVELDGHSYSTGSWQSSSQLGLTPEGEISDVELLLATVDCLDMVQRKSAKAQQDQEEGLKRG